MYSDKNDMIHGDKKYAEVKDNITVAVIITGIAASAVGAVYNQINGYESASVIIHAAGFFLLAAALAVYMRLSKTVALAAVFAYFCFVYTPFVWVTMMGLYGSITYIVYVFSVLIIILIEGRACVCFSVAYFAEVMGLVAYSAARQVPRDPPTPFFSLAFSYVIMMFILILVTGIYKYRFMKFLALNRRDTITDVLTGLYNFRYLTDALADTEVWYRTSPGRDYYIAVIDLDYFKEINDSYGHNAGDDVLHELGELMDRIFRDDIAGRYGGDEFVVIFRDRSLDYCEARCEALNEAVKTREFTEYRIKLSFSIGLCGRNQIKDGDIFAHADAILYAAKARRIVKRTRSVRPAAEK